MLRRVVITDRHLFCRRQAAQVAAVAINASSNSPDDPPEMMSVPTSSVVQSLSGSSHLDTDSDLDDEV